MVTTVIFLFTDIEGSTQLWERHQQAMQAPLARHDALLRQAVAAHNGQIVKMTGDGCHAAFASARDGALAALAAQHALALETWPEIHPEVLRVRMGLYAGEVEARDGDYYGSSVNRAARLMSVGHGGQILISQIAADLLRDRLPTGAALRDLGEHRLKDLTRPERILQLTAPGLQADFPPIKSLDAFRHNLPIQLTNFIGRAREMAEVQRLLAGTRLLALTGPGGTGKTRLSLQVAAEVLTAFADGVWLVELAPLADPALVVQTVAAVFDLRPPPGVTPLNAVTDYLRAKQQLLLLDNCEHLVEACAQLADHLLRACPRLKIIASSREALGIAGETNYRVPSLSLPDPQAVDPQSLIQSEAAQLFVDRALAAQPRFKVTAQNSPAIAQICGRLDGIPLALELAAARVKVFTPEQIATRLDDRFRLLTGGSRTALPRQQTLRALIDWSHDLLPEPERALLRRLSVFAGGWALEAADAICAGGQGSAGILLPADVIDALTRLVDKSLVVVDENVPGGEARYRLLETIRQYARDRLLESGESALVRDRHLDWFVCLAEEAEPGLRGSEALSWLVRLTLEQENLRAALAWGLEHRPEDALAIAGNLQAFWAKDMGLSGGRDWVQKTLERTAALPPADGEGAARRLLRRARGLTAACLLAMNQGFANEAHALSAEAVALARASGDRSLLAYALSFGVAADTLRGDLPSARAAGEESLVLARDLGEMPFLVMCLAQLALVSAQQADSGARQQYVSELRQLLGQTRLLLVGLPIFLIMGMEEHIHGDLDSARSYFQEAVRAARQINNPYMEQAAQSELAHIVRQTGDLPQAKDLYRQTLLKWANLGHRAAIAHDLECVAFIARAEDLPERAARLLGAAEALREAIGAPMADYERAEYDTETTQLRAALDPARLEMAWGAGRASTMEQAIEYALGAGGRN
jgi:predicted ATPase/class 3 adenylate cyclase